METESETGEIGEMTPAHGCSIVSSLALHLSDSFIHLAGWNFKKSVGFILHRTDQSRAKTSGWGLKQTNIWGPDSG